MTFSNTVGIICEYDPFHLGHVRHIRLTRRLAGEDAVVICAMSGSFTQRGDLAMFPKWDRAACALSEADVVVELPLSGSLSSGELFAVRGVQTLDAMGAKYLSFGSESGSVEPLMRAADAILSAEYPPLLRQALDSGASYASAAQTALSAILGDGARVLLTPNNLLGIEYLKAIRNLDSPMEPMTVRRPASRDPVSSARVRAAVLNGEDFRGTVPAVTFDAIRRLISSGDAPARAENCQKALMLKLRSMSARDFAALPRCTEGLDAKLESACRNACSVEAVIDAVKSRRYARTRIQRLIMCALLDLDASYFEQPPAFIRLLGATDRGRAFLRRNRDAFSLPIISRASEVKKLPYAARRQFDALSAATDLHYMALPGDRIYPAGMEWRRGPVFPDSSAAGI
ncbi:MAG: nucleotidyltransferase family protein [Oscillospiraceae bacterium]|nr:nucleotidyltransferase family protein [Oscillospiraceae bacterium]